MKKKIMISIFACSALLLSGCAKTESQQTEAPNVQTEDVVEIETEAVKQKDLPDEDREDTGNGTAYISCSGGTSENGNIPVIFVSDEILIQIGLNTYDFDGSKLSYVYIDGMLATKEQLAESQISLDLSGDALSIGKHEVAIVQYNADEPSNDIITYKSASYEVKTK